MQNLIKIHAMRHLARLLAKSATFMAIALLLASASFAQDKNCALVLMHGKWGSMQNLVFFEREMSTACTVKSLEMPWSGRRAYDQPYPVAMQEINTQVKAFRTQGFKHVLVGGQSFGTNAALAYMATLGDADGVIALAPGHSPKLMYDRGISKTVVDQARELVDAGRGEEPLTMDDLNQGKRRSMRMSATTLLSYFDPAGLGHMPATAAGFKKAVPVLWVIGTADPLYPAGEGYAYARLPAHAKSKYWVVEADHINTPEVAAQGTLEWIKTLD
ncbi:MAG: alpha/beta hydrolase [Pseudomonadota bacterium]